MAMGGAWIAWLVAAFAVAAVFAVAFWARNQVARAKALAVERDQWSERARQAEKRFEQRNKDDRHRGDDLAELRRKLEKARKRAADTAEEKRGVEERLRDAEEALRRARSERVQHVEAATPPAPIKPAPAPPVVVAGPRPEDLELQKSLTQRAERAEARVAALDRELHAASFEAARWRKRARSLEAAYTQQHLELQAKKDRLRTQQEELERLRALRVALGVPEPEAPAGPPLDEERAESEALAEIEASERDASDPDGAQI
jgi:DNA repair exonuclease SbcCD ATPase subunit